MNDESHGVAGSAANTRGTYRMVDPDLLPLLRCVECGSSGLRRSADRLVCDAITRTYEVRPPGIPRLITDEIGRRNAVHEHEWDSMPQPDYDEICRDNRAVWNAIHSLAMKYCNGFALEVCCGSRVPGHAETRCSREESFWTGCLDRHVAKCVGEGSSRSTAKFGCHVPGQPSDLTRFC